MMYQVEIHVIAVKNSMGSCALPNCQRSFKNQAPLSTSNKVKQMLNNVSTAMRTYTEIQEVHL